jgi:hypothetical protein
MSAAERSGTDAASLPAQLQRHYPFHFTKPRRERLFLASVGFGAGAITVRTVTHMIRHGIGPFRNVSGGGRHLHHLVFGIFGLLGSGYLWLLIADDPNRSPRDQRLTSVAYGLGSALTLDEFALWLNLEDVYWARQGRESVQALMLFGAALSMGLWGGPFLRAALRELAGSTASAKPSHADSTLVVQQLNQEDPAPVFPSEAPGAHVGAWLRRSRGQGRLWPSHEPAD